ncbi:MAG: DUF1778 domain-containing protein [Hydrococcus sp. RM1_1_31]|nr:DUF1778 domain-containing protein [Hydrococcus sp. RM1_1_31]
MPSTKPSQSNSEKQRAKEERLEARLTVSQKELLQQAALLEGTTLTEFVIRSATEQARQILDKHRLIQLSLKDSQAFVEALLNPPEPNERMVAAAKKYKRSLNSR